MHERIRRNRVILGFIAFLLFFVLISCGAFAVGAKEHYHEVRRVPYHSLEEAVANYCTFESLPDWVTGPDAIVNEVINDDGSDGVLDIVYNVHPQYSDVSIQPGQFYQLHLELTTIVVGESGILWWYEPTVKTAHSCEIMLLGND